MMRGEIMFACRYRTRAFWKWSPTAVNLKGVTCCTATLSSWLPQKCVHARLSFLSLWFGRDEGSRGAVISCVRADSSFVLRVSIAVITDQTISALAAHACIIACIDSRVPRGPTPNTCASHRHKHKKKDRRPWGDASPNLSMQMELGEKKKKRK
jgi:hypothetical protein